jgi:hypothetical protein
MQGSGGSSVCEETACKEVEFKFSRTVNVKMTGFYDVTPCNHVEV